MSIGSSPFQGGGSSSIADATESTAGKIRIATTSESTAGTNDVTAMTPAKVKARIDAALVGGVEYKGTFNATTGLTNSGGNLNNAEQGDLYVIDTAGTIYGADWEVGDHLLINADMGGSISNSKIDKVDNTEADTLDTVTGRGATTSNAVQVGGLNIAGSYALPTSDGSAGQILKTDGSGALTFQSLGSISTQAANSVNITGGAISGITDLAIADGGTGASTEAQARTNLGLAIGSDVQAHDAGLDSISGLTTAADKMIYTTGSDTYAVTSLTAAGRALLDDANAAAQQATLGLGTAATQDVGTSANNVVQLDGSSRLPAIDGSLLTGITATDSTKLAIANNLSDLNNAGTARTNLGLAIGSDVQAHDAGLDSISGLTTAADKMIYTTGSDTYAVTSLTAAGRALLDDADVAAQQATLGLGTAATKDVGTSANNVVQLDGSSRLPAVDGSQLTGITATDSTKLAIANNLSDLNNTGTARTNLGLAIGSDVQAHDAGLDSISGLTTAADKMIYTTGSDTYAVTDLTSAGRALLDDADAAAQRTTLGLVIGTDVLSDVIQDTSPQLGGNLDLNGQDIVTTSNANLELAPDGTGVVSIKGNSTGGVNPGALKLWCENNSHGISIKSPPHSATASYELVLPTGVGTSGQVLKTDGGDGGTPNSVQLAWVDQASGGGGWTYSAITADPANAQAGYHYSCTGTFTITLPTSGVSAGEEIRVKNMGSGTVTIDPQTQNIDGATTDYVMDVQFGAITLVSTGSHWEII